MPVIIFPENYSEVLLDEITRDVDRAAHEIGVAVVGGHTGYAQGLNRTLITCTAAGITRGGRYVTTCGTKPGDHVIVTKGAGIEGTSIVAYDFEDVLKQHDVALDVIDDARKMAEEISVIKESLALAKAGATSMHDATRGGVLDALIEIALSSNVSIEAWE